MSDVRVQHYVDLAGRHGLRAVIEFLVGVIDEERRAMADGDGKATEPACSPLPPCALCGRTEYPVEYGPRQNKLPAGSLVGFDNGERVWICRRCSRDPAALERLETDASLTANKQEEAGR
jgi:hypothetical protein